MKAMQYIDMIESATSAAEIQSLLKRAACDAEVETTADGGWRSVYGAARKRRNALISD